MARLNKGERTRLILEAVARNPANLYDALEEMGYPRSLSWQYIPRLKKWGYIERTGKSRYALTVKGEAALRRLTIGQVRCPLCNSLARRNGTRKGKQRWRCPKCGFGFTSGCEETLVASLKRRNKAVFIIYCDNWEANKVHFSLKAWIQEKRMEAEFRSVSLIEL